MYLITGKLIYARNIMINIAHHVEQNISLLITINSNYFFFSVEDFPQPMNTRKYNETQ